jgi:hypothetical protein
VFLAGADDVIELPDTTHEAAVAELGLAWAKDRALQLTLGLLDGATRANTRAEAAEGVGELFAEPFSGRPGEVEAFVANRLYSAPMPLGESDLPGAITIAASADPTGVVASLLRAVDAAQPRIAKLHTAWEGLPLDLFGGVIVAEDADRPMREKRRSESVLIDLGAFRTLATTHGAALLKAAQGCAIAAGEWGVSRSVVEKWAHPLMRAREARDKGNEGDCPEA